MKKIKFLLALLMLGMLTSINAQNPKEITQKATDISNPDAFEMTSTLTTYDSKGRERVRQTTSATKKFGETTKTILKFLSPADVKGTGILIFDYKNKDDDMWIYLPALRRTRRIISSEKSKSFMGSEFSNVDMSRPNPDDFNYKLDRTTQYEGKTCWVIESTPKTDKIADENGYSKKIALIDKNSYEVYQVKYYDLDGELWKVMTVSDYQDLGNGKVMARKMEIKNVQNGRRSVLSIDKLQMGSSLTENNFTTAMLEK